MGADFFFLEVHLTALSSKQLPCNHSGSDPHSVTSIKPLSIPLSVILNPDFQPRELPDGLCLRPSALTVRLCGDYKGGPALVFDLRGRCGVLLRSRPPQQFYSRFSQKHRGHGSVMQGNPESLRQATDSHHWLSGWHNANKIEHHTAAECRLNSINAALLVNQTLFLSPMELESQTSL